MTAVNTESNEVTAFIGEGSAALARASLRGPTWQHVEWHGLALRVPSDWEIVRHGLSLAVGTLRFVDRRRERLSLSWAAVRSSPDLGRLLEESTAGGPDSEAPRAFELDSWRGIVRETRSGIETRAVAHHAPTSRLLELVVSSPPDELSLVGEILGSLRARDTSAEGWRYRAFGLDVLTPGDFVLTSAPVAPCDVTFCFERPAKGRKRPLLRFSARRLGMAAAWFRGDFAQLLAAKVEGVEHGPLEAVSLNGREAHASRGRCIEKRWVRLFGRGREERALLWSAPDENAIYLLRSEGPVGAALDPRDFAAWGVVAGEKLDAAE